MPHTPGNWVKCPKMSFSAETKIFHLQSLFFLLSHFCVASVGSWHNRLISDLHLSQQGWVWLCPQRKSSCLVLKYPPAATLFNAVVPCRACIITWAALPCHNSSRSMIITTLTRVRLLLNRIRDRGPSHSGRGAQSIPPE